MEDGEIDFKEIFFIMKKNIWLILIVFILLFSGITYYTFTVTPEFEATSTVVVDVIDVSFSVFSEESRKVDVYTEVSIIESAIVMQSIENKYGNFDYEILPIKNSRLIKITVNYPNPILVDDLANEIGESYIQYTASAKKENAHEVLNVLAVQINTTKEELEKINEQIFSVQKKKERTFTEELSYVKISDSITKAQDEYKYLITRKRNLEETIVSVSAERNEIKIAQTLLITIETEINEILIEIETLQNNLLLIELDEKLSTTEEIMYLGLLQSKTIKEQQLVQLLSRQETVSIAKATAYASIVDEAVTPEEPISPNIPLNLIIGLIISIIGALGLVYLKESIRGTVKTVSEIEQITGLSLIGELPRMQGKVNSYLAQHHSRGGIFADKMRMLRTNVLFGLQEKNNKIILTTSASRKDGKTTTAVNLAVSLTHNKQKVLLIDTNVQEPKLEDVFKAKVHIKGLSDVITGNAKLSDTIVETRVKGLSVLFAGDKNDYPGELFNSKEMKELLETVKKKYDVIIMDGSHCEYAETMSLARQVDSILFVVKNDITTSQSLEEATKHFIKKVNKKIHLIRNYM